MCPYSVKIAVVTSKITPIEKGCKIFELTKVNLLFLVKLVLNNYVLVVAWALQMAACRPLFFNGMPSIVLKMVRSKLTISVSMTVRS